MVSGGVVMLFTVGHVGSLFFFGKKKESLTSNNKSKTIDEASDCSMLCKFVLDPTGKQIGESVSVTDDMLIIKSSSHFLGVPLKHVELRDRKLVIKGLIDVTKAYELGEKWRKESYRELTLPRVQDEKSK